MDTGKDTDIIGKRKSKRAGKSFRGSTYLVKQCQVGSNNPERNQRHPKTRWFNEINQITETKGQENDNPAMNT